MAPTVASLVAEQERVLGLKDIASFVPPRNALEELRRSLLCTAVDSYPVLDPTWKQSLGTTTALDQALLVGSFAALDDAFIRSAEASLFDYSSLLERAGFGRTQASEVIRTAYSDIQYATRWHGAVSVETDTVDDPETKATEEFPESVSRTVVHAGTLAFLEDVALKLLRRIAERCRLATTLPVADGRWGPVASDLVCCIAVAFPDHAASLAIKAGRISTLLAMFAAPSGETHVAGLEALSLDDVNVVVDVLEGFVAELEALENKYMS